MRLQLFQLLFVFALLRLAIGVRLLVVTSARTPSDLQKFFSPEGKLAWQPANVEATVVSVEQFADLVAAVPFAAMVLDAAFSQLGEELIAGVCKEAAVPHAVVGYSGSEKTHEWTYYLNSRQSDLAQALDSIVAFFNWTRVNLITDNSPQFLSIPDELRGITGRSYTVFTLLSTDAESVASAVGKGLRLGGNRVNVFATEAELAKEIVDKQYAKYIGGAGFGNLLPLLSSLFSANTFIPSEVTGNLILAEEELAAVKSQTEYYAALLAIVTELVDDFATSETVKRKLDGRYPTHSRTGGFVLLNMQQGKRVPVGKLTNGKFSIQSTIYFLGNATDVPKNANSPLPISGNLGSRNPVGYSTTSPTYYKGALLAVDDVNSWPSILENFDLVMFNFTAGTSVWNYNFAYNNIAPYKDQLGLAVIAGSGSTVAMNMIELLKEFGYHGPVVGALNTVNTLSSRERFPNYVRTIVSDDFVVQVYLQMFKLYGWKRCGLLVSNETWGLGFQRVFTQLAHDNGISILNDPELQVLPNAIPSVDTLRNYSSNFQHLIDTKVRVLIIVLTNNMFYVLDYLYELGMRAGDYEIVAHEGMSMGIFRTNDTEVNRKRSEIAKGSIQFAPASYIGKLGAKVYNDYYARFKLQPPVYACYYYDAVLAIAYAFDLILRSGGDYTNQDAIMKALRGSRFVGCTGTVTFEQYTNDRSPMQYNILNAQMGENGTYVTNITIVSIYDPASATLITPVQEVIWCDGSLTVPPDLRGSTIGCPFEDKFDHSFLKGKQLLYGICAMLVTLTVTLVAVTWRKWRYVTVKRLTQAKEIQLDDVVLMAGVAIELIQYISIGPDLSYYSPQAFSLISSATFDIKTYVTYKDGGFEKVWLGVVLAILMWIPLCVVMFFQLDFRLKWFPGCRTVGEIAELVAPFIGNIFFLPLLSILIDVFVCVRGVGVSADSVQFPDSYLHYDCYLPCWKGLHRAYAVASCVTLSLFVPAAIALRPLWQEVTEQLNIRCSIQFLMVKTVIQVSLVVLNKTLKLESETAYSFVFLCVMLGFIAFCIRVECFGYKRTALWQVLSLVAVCWSTLLVIVYDSTGSSSFEYFMGAAAAGFALISLFGVVYQSLRIPSMLYRKKGVDTQILFKFAFKPANSVVLSSLKENFQAAGLRSRVIIPESSAPQTRYELPSDDLEGQRNVVHSHRVAPSSMQAAQ